MSPDAPAQPATAAMPAAQAPAAESMPGGHTAAMQPAAGTNKISAARFQDDMRQLWEDHLVYTRNFIISALAGLGDTAKVADRLLRNQDDVGNAVKPLYGEDAGKKLAAC